MLILQILSAVAALYLLAYLMAPKGFFLYEGTRILNWVYRLKLAQRNGPLPLKLVYGPHSRQYVLYFAPKEAANGDGKIYVYFHGSGWQYSKPELFRAHAKMLTSLGYHVFLPSHRRIPMARILELKEDASLALLKIIEKSKELGLDTGRIILTGNSSGGHLCSLLSFDRELQSKAGFRQSQFAGLVLMGAPLNLHKMWPSPPLLMLAGRRNSALFKQANPIDYLRPSESLPILMIHGDRDGIVEHKNAVSFFEKARQLQARDIKMVTLPGGTHLDSASWCFPGHPCHVALFGWLAELEAQDKALTEALPTN